MEATFSLSRHFYTEPLFALHHKKPPVPRFHVDHGYHLQPSSPPSFALQAWPTTLKAHRTTWAVDALPKAKGNGWDCMPSWSTQSKVSRNARAVNSLPTPKANGRDGPRAWTTAFIVMTAVAACSVGAVMGMRGMMVTPPAIAALVHVQQASPKHVVGSEALNEFLGICREGLLKGEGDDAAEKVSSQLRNVWIDYPTLKENARKAMASGQAKKMVKMLKKKFDEDLKKDGGEKALEIGLILIEMLILQGKPKKALGILSDLNNIIEEKGSKAEGRPYLYQAAANLLRHKPDEAKKAWDKFATAAAENRSMHESPKFQDGDKKTFEDLENSITSLKSRHGLLTRLKNRVLP